MLIHLQNETQDALNFIPKDTVSRQSADFGMLRGEPILAGLDGVLRYAKAYRKRFDSRVAEDGVLGPAWLKVATGLRELLNGDGAVAMEKGRATDSKDNGACEAIFWKAIEAAGFSEKDL